MKLTIEKLEEMILEELNEATNQQKTQQRKANWDTRDRHRKELKAKIKRSQPREPADFSFKNERPDFDPIIVPTGNVIIRKLISGEQSSADTNKMDDKLIAYVLQDPNIERIGDKLVLKQAEN